MTQLIDVTSIGEAMVEFSETKQGIWIQGVGGDTLNVAVAAQRAGATTAFATASVEMSGVTP